MRIIHVIDYFQPKLGYQETFLARAHARLGHDVYVVTSDRYSPDVYPQNRSLLGARIKGTGLFTEEGIRVWRLAPLFEFPRAIWLRGLERKIEELKPDLVIMHMIANFSALRMARLKNRRGNFRLIYDDHSTPANSLSPMRVLYPLVRWLGIPSIKKAADALVAILPDTRDFMYQRYRIPRESITVIPLGADDVLFRFDPAARDQVRRELSIADHETAFIYTGKISPIKRLPLLIEAASELAHERFAVKVILLGEGAPDYIRELERLIQEHDSGRIFIWHEAVDNRDLYRYYSGADAAVWPYGPSISMREAMSCRLPIVMAQGSGVEELVAQGNGLVFRTDNASDLAGKMKILLDPGARAEMGGKSRRLIEDRFNWQAIARQFIDAGAGH